MAVEQLITQHIDTWTSALRTRSTAGRGSNGKIDLYGIKKLRELILELAVRGKLVPQDPNDEPASELLKYNEKRKQELAKDGSMKTAANGNINFVDYYLATPKTWSWIRLGNLAKFIDYRGKTPKKTESGIRLITAKNIKKGFIDLNPEEFIAEQDYQSWMTRGFPKNGDILFTTEAPLGNAAIIDLNDKFALAQRSICFQWHIPEISPFMLIQILAKPFQSQLNDQSTGMTATGIKAAKLKEIPVILPPMHEQEKVVARVKELMSLCDQLEQQSLTSQESHSQLVETLLAMLTASQNAEELAENWARISQHFDTLFTTEASIDSLKQTILQLAVMGKLVPQDPTDEPASELLKRIEQEKTQLVKEGKIKKQKPSPAISEDEKPFELPVGWEWCRIMAIAQVGTGSTPSRDNPDYWSEPEFNWVTSGETSSPFIIDTAEKVSMRAVKETNVSIYPPGTLIIAMYGQGKTRGQITELRIAAGTNQACAAIQLFESNEFHRRYIKFFFEKSYDDLRSHAAGGAQPNLNLAKVSNTLIPIPPLAEQIEIAAKIDELFVFCDSLKSRLQSAQQTQLHLADALTDAALN
ncbi:restriction endonuclease subunit S [Serratia proteamaculans]|uniref:restriction endonuclease subunit S n=1 Tax=Serratia proteamaculans TaxID=28151 RepID=UPI0039BEBE3E